MTVIDDPSLYDSGADKKMKLKTISTDILALMETHIAGLIYDRVEEEFFGASVEYQFWNGSSLADAIRLYKEGDRWRIKPVTATAIIITEDGKNIVQDDGGKILTE